MNLQIIIGSVRQGRVGAQIATWVYNRVKQKNSNLNPELLDLLDWHLPMNNEPNLPATGKYTQEHTIKWSKKINEGNLYIFVTPEYNSGYPAALKNAIDHLFIEWQNKPALIISYGHGSGVKSAEQLKQVLERIKMHTTASGIAIPLAKFTFDDTGKINNIDTALKEYEKVLSTRLEEMVK